MSKRRQGKTLTEVLETVDTQVPYVAEPRKGVCDVLLSLHHGQAGKQPRRTK